MYFDLATWHLINTVYAPARVAELARMRSFYSDAAHHERLMTVVAARLGHALVAQAEAAKIAVAEGGCTTLDLGSLQAGLRVQLQAASAVDAVQADLRRIVAAAIETLAQAGLRSALAWMRCTSPAGPPVCGRWRRASPRAFPRPRWCRAIVLPAWRRGLGVHAQRLFGTAA